MKRRELLRGLFALSAAGVVNGCRADDQRDHDDSHHETKTLKVVIQGPFAVVLKKRDERYSISAFIPPTVPPEAVHQFRFQTPMSVVENPVPKYHFTLGTEGLEVNERRRPYIDHGLDDMNFDLGEYPAPNYFVSIDLPVPDLITFIPPSEPVVFVDGRIAFAPLNHVLEYKVRDLPKVLLHSEQLKDTAPLAFSEIFKGYQDHFNKEHEYKDKPGHGPQFPRTKPELERPSEADVYTFFFGVGVPPGMLSDDAAVQHGLEFFNKRLVPLFPNSKDLKPLSEIRNYGDPCTPMKKTAPARMQPAVLRESMQKPRLLLVTGAEDCRAPGLMGGGG